MIAAALLALIGASLLSTMTFAAKSASKTRARSVASAEANRIIDQLYLYMQIASAKSVDVARFCDLVKAAGGPLGPSATGTCPNLTVSGRAVEGSTLAADVVLASQNLGTKPGLFVTVTVRSPELADPVVVHSHLRR